MTSPDRETEIHKHEGQTPIADRAIDFLSLTHGQSVQVKETIANINLYSENPAGRFALDLVVVQNSEEGTSQVRQLTLTEGDLIRTRNKLVTDIISQPEEKRRAELLEILLQTNSLQATGEAAVKPQS